MIPNETSAAEPLHFFGIPVIEWSFRENFKGQPANANILLCYAIYEYYIKRC